MQSALLRSDPGLLCRNVTNTDQRHNMCSFYCPHDQHVIVQTSNGMLLVPCEPAHALSVQTLEPMSFTCLLFSIYTFAGYSQGASNNPQQTESSLEPQPLLWQC